MLDNLLHIPVVRQWLITGDRELMNCAMWEVVSRTPMKPMQAYDGMMLYRHSFMCLPRDLQEALIEDSKRRADPLGVLFEVIAESVAHLLRIPERTKARRLKLARLRQEPNAILAKLPFKAVEGKTYRYNRTDLP